MIRGVIFDLDGVLLDSMHYWKGTGAAFLKKLGIEADEDLNDQLNSMSMEQGAEYMQKRYQLALSPEEIRQGVLDGVRDLYYYEIPRKAGTLELLEFLKEKKIPMLAATSSPREHVTKALERTGLLPFLQQIFTNSEIGKSKHSPLIFELSAQALGFMPSEILVVEDSLYALLTAKQAGFRVVGIFDDSSEELQDQLEAESDLYIHGMIEIKEHWEQLNQL